MPRCASAAWTRSQLGQQRLGCDRPLSGERRRRAPSAASSASTSRRSTSSPAIAADDRNAERSDSGGSTAASNSCLDAQPSIVGHSKTRAFTLAPDAELARQPRLCGSPVPFGGRRRHFQHVRRFVDRQSAERPQLDDPREAGIELVPARQAPDPARARVFLRSRQLSTTSSSGTRCRSSPRFLAA